MQCNFTGNGTGRIWSFYIEDSSDKLDILDYVFMCIKLNLVYMQMF